MTRNTNVIINRIFNLQNYYIGNVQVDFKVISYYSRQIKKKKGKLNVRFCFSVTTN